MFARDAFFLVAQAPFSGAKINNRHFALNPRSACRRVEDLVFTRWTLIVVVLVLIGFLGFHERSQNADCSRSHPLGLCKLDHFGNRLVGLVANGCANFGVAAFAYLAFHFFALPVTVEHGQGSHRVEQLPVAQFHAVGHLATFDRPVVPEQAFSRCPWQRSSVRDDRGACSHHPESVCIRCLHRQRFARPMPRFRSSAFCA